MIRRPTTHELTLTTGLPSLALHIDHGSAVEALSAVYLEGLRVAGSNRDDAPQLQLCRSEATPAVEIDAVGHVIRISGDPIPYTLIKQGIRWVAAATTPPGSLPFHAVILRFSHTCLAIVGRGRAGKSHMARLLLGRAPGHMVSDDWAILDTGTRVPHWPGDCRLHVRGSDLHTIADRNAAVAFELVDDDPNHYESRYLTPRDRDPTMSMPAADDSLTHIVFIGDGQSRLHFDQTASARDRERNLRKYLWDDSLSMLPESIAKRMDADWDRLLDGLNIALLEGHRRSEVDTAAAVTAISTWSALT